MFNENKIIEGLKQWLGPITEAITEGFATRKTAYADHVTIHRSTTRAGLTNDHIVDCACKRLEPLGVKVRRIQSRVLFEFPTGVFITFKRLTKQKLPRNVRTKSAEKFWRQTELSGLFQDFPRLVAGFIPSDDWTKCDGIYITMPRNLDTAEWSFSLLPEAVTPQFPQFEKTETSNDKLSNRSRVRAKSGVSVRKNTKRKAAGG